MNDKITIMNDKMTIMNGKIWTKNLSTNLVSSETILTNHQEGPIPSEDTEKVSKLIRKGIR